MVDYEKMYYTLFNAITDALRLMEAGQNVDAAIRLAAAQCQTEELYMEGELKAKEEKEKVMV